MSDAYQEYKKQFKKPIRQIAELMPRDFTDDDFIKVTSNNHKSDLQ